ncbi:Sphingosine-1-phosphate lyase [Coccomyxa sp. Obi]|nr:Sphingosine-1-phosphate lyase [Coccomyxa sp. Obi]
MLSQPSIMHGLSTLQQATADAMTRMKPHAEEIWRATQIWTYPAWQHAAPHLDSTTRWIDAHFAGMLPWQVVAITAVAVLLLVWVLQWVYRGAADLKEAGVLQSMFEMIKSLPGIRGIVQREHAKMLVKIRASIDKGNEVSHEQYLELPKVGMAAEEVKARLQSRGKRDVVFEDGSSKVSGTLYLMGEEHCRLLNDVYASFSHTNPMHADVFPSVRQMELEVVAMTASMLGGGPAGDPEVCGAMTSGGTESILTAVKASRDYMRAKKGIRSPEMVVGQSAHAAFFKAAEYFNVKLVTVPVGRDYRVSAAAVARAMTRNTVLVVASSPCFPHGVIDDVAGIAALARRRGVCCHVDACLGGFVLPFARAAGYAVPPFDFAVPGVTSMSVDTHKFGMAHKGTSVVLYRSAAIRRHQYTRVTEWSGGLYISPGFAGSRSGALISTAWASMMHQGLEGYVALTDQMMKAAKEFAEGIEAIEGLELAGQPAMTVVAFKAVKPRALNIYAVNDALSARGWHLNALQLPPALHMCFTAQHATIVKPLLKDLGEIVEELQSGGEEVKDGMAPVYGLASVSPDRNIIGEFLVAYQDVLLSG